MKWLKNNLPYPVWESNSAAPPMGLVKTPTIPLPRPLTIPEAVFIGVAGDNIACKGWSAIPATAPKNLWEMFKLKMHFTQLLKMHCKILVKGGARKCWSYLTSNNLLIKKKICWD